MNKFSLTANRDVKNIVDKNELLKDIILIASVAGWFNITANTSIEEILKEFKVGTAKRKCPRYNQSSLECCLIREFSFKSPETKMKRTQDNVEEATNHENEQVHTAPAGELDSEYIKCMYMIKALDSVIVRCFDHLHVGL